MDKVFFIYSCIFFDEIDNKKVNATGVVYSDTYANAVAELEKYYGTTIDHIKIHALEGEPPVYKFCN